MARRGRSFPSKIVQVRPVKPITAPGSTIKAFPLNVVTRVTTTTSANR